MVPKRGKGRNNQWLLLKKRRRSRPLRGWGKAMADGRAELVNPTTEKKPELKKGK